MIKSLWLFGVASVFLASSCGSSSNGGGGGVTTGAAELSFTMDEAVRVNFRGELVGSIEGQLYPTADLNFVGGSVVSAPDPNDAVADVQVDMADFRMVDTLPETQRVEGLEPDAYTFLGALDTDDNGNDIGDPVTFSMQGSFTVTAGSTAPFQVVFNGIQPF